MYRPGSRPSIYPIPRANSVASMVVFEKGKPNKQEYRRFRIRGIVGPDDYSSMSQVIMRRFKRGLEEKKELDAKDRDPDEGKFSRFPDLILIDGGKGQLNVAVSTLREMGIDYIPVISLAEKFDEVFTEGKEEPLVMPKNSLGLQLLQRIRDEAHRFALTYHRSLHSKNSIRSYWRISPYRTQQTKGFTKAFWIHQGHKRCQPGRIK